MREQRTKVKRGQSMLSEQEFCIMMSDVNQGNWEYAGSFPERIYKILLPHLRGEFPREAIRDLLKGYPMIYDTDRHSLIRSLEGLTWNSEQEEKKPAYPARDYGFEAGYSFRRHEEHIEKHGHPNGSNCPNPNEEGLCGCCATCGGRAGHICADGRFRRWPGMVCSNCGNGLIDPCPKCKPCATCGGSKMVDANYSSGYGGIRTKPPQTPCPDCTEHQGGYLPENMVCRYPWDHVHTHACVIEDQRKGQRRKGKEIPTVYNYADGATGPGFADPVCVKPDCRTGDERRSKTLTGSLKAMRPQEEKP